MVLNTKAVGRAAVPGSTLTRERVTAGEDTLNLLGVPAEPWPVEDFVKYLRNLMDNASIRDFAELSRLSNVSETQFSNWRRGIAQPSKASLNKVAPVLGVKPVRLWFAAGLATMDDLDLGEAPDLTELPMVELDDVRQMLKDPRITDEDRQFVKQQLRLITSWVQTEMDRRGAAGGPAVRRRRVN